MYALRIDDAGRQEQHIALAEQIFRTHLVKNRAAVDFAGHLESNACRNIGFNQAGNDIHAWALGGKNQMDAGCACFLGKTGNQFFDFLACSHHQIGKLIYHDHDKRQFLQWFRIFRREAERAADFFATSGGFGNFLVETGKVAHAHKAHQAVAFFHFVDAPVQRVCGQLHIGYDRGEQVRNAFVNAQFQHFRVNHNHAHVFRRCFEEHGQNHGVHAYGFTRTGRTGNQQMRRFGQVGDDRLAGDVLAEREGQFGFGLGKCRRIEDFAQADHLAFRIRQFQAHAGFAGDGFHHADGSHAKRARQVFFKVQNGTAAYADIRLNFVARNDRAGIGVHHFDFNFELGQFFFDGNAVFQQLFFSLRGAWVKLRRQEQGSGR